MEENKRSESPTRRTMLIISAFAVAEVLLHLYTNAFAGYGYFRDELYYVACSKHLAFGYVDQPPLSALILFIVIKLCGNSVFTMRLLPALVSGVTVYLTGLTTLKLKGGDFAVSLACLSVAIAPEFLGANATFSMNTFDWMSWALAAYIVVQIIDAEKSVQTVSLWVLLGVVMGFGLLNKIDILWFGFGLLIGMVFSEHRRRLKTIWPYVSGAIAFLLFSPYIIWNATHNFATLEFIHNASAIKYASLNPGTYISDTVRSLNEFTLPVWLGGIYLFFFHKEGKRYRLLGYLFLVPFFVLIVNWHSKPEYIAPAFPVVFAGGGVIFEKIISFRGFGWIKYVMPLLISFYGILAMPFAIPILPVQSFISYSRALGVKPSTAEGLNLANLPQWYSDMFGWENMAETVSKTYLSLPAAERKKTIVFARNYGEAGAIDFFRSKYSLPRVICGHNNYWYWGPGDTSFTTVILIGGSESDHRAWCSSVRAVDTIRSQYAIPYENNLPVWICGGFEVPFMTVWIQSRFFI